MHNLIYKGENSPIFFFYKSDEDIDVSKLKLHIYKNTGFNQVDTTFEKIDKYFYKCVVKFDFTGKYYFKVTYKDERIGGGVITIAENILQKIYEMEFGTWEIKDNKMHFYDTKGNLLASFALYDSFGNPSSESVFLRKRIDN